MKGKRSYKIARMGEEIERKARQVTFHALEITSVTDDAVELDVSCSSGTYIRSLAHDLGQHIGCPSTLTSLRRLESAPFSLADAFPPADFNEGRRAVVDCLVPIESALPPLARVEVPEESVQAVFHGRTLVGVPGPASTELVLLMTPAGTLLALGERVGDDISVKRVIAT